MNAIDPKTQRPKALSWFSLKSHEREIDIATRLTSYPSGTYGSGVTHRNTG